MNNINLCFLDNKTFEKLDNVIEVDKDISNTISILNKKGYQTFTSCAGHNKLLDYRRQECEIDLLEELDGNEDFKDSIIVDKTDKSFGLVTPVGLSRIYIKFKKKYNFNSLPDTFSYRDDIIESIIYYYDGGKKISSEELDREIERRNDLLLKWANNLPINKERND